MAYSTRRHFLGVLGAVVVTPFLSTRVSGTSRPRAHSPHPTPRVGITSKKVATRDQLSGKPSVIPVFDQVREIPEIADGIRCQCGCADGKNYYSLLSCYEAPDLMAKECEICQAQGRLAYRLHKAGKSLDEIRRGIEARFGGD